MKIKKLGALLVSAALCAGMAAPAFAFEGEATPVEQPVLPEVVEEDVVTVTDETSGALTPEGNLTLVDDYYTNYSDGSGQQFITLVSKSGNTFYLVIDRNAIAELLGARTHPAAEGLVTWGIRSTAGGQFRDLGPAGDNDSENYEKNCQTARELMQAAGYTAGALAKLGTVTMLYESDGITDSLAALLQKTWKEKLGLDVTLQGVTTAQIDQALARGEYTIAALRVSSDRNDATGFLNSWRKGNEDNYANFYSSAYDMLLRVAAVSVSQEARDAYLEDAERLLLEQGNVIPLYYSTISWSLSEHYTGVFSDGLGRYFFYAVHKASK